MFHFIHKLCSCRPISANTELSDDSLLNIPMLIIVSECGPPEIHHWDIGYFSYQGNTLYADCSYYKTYMGTLSMICDNDTNTWVTSGECEEYSTYLNVNLKTMFGYC